MMGIEVYYAPASPPSRIVLTTCKALGVDVNRHLVDLAKGEHMTADFLKMNPQHTVPVLVDNDLILNESRAIMTYLADKYGKCDDCDTLYPRCPRKRAVINARLFFDATMLFQRFGDLYYPMIFGGAPLDEEKQKKLDEAFAILDQYLDKTRWAAADQPTLADISLAVTASTAEVMGYNISQHGAVAKWLERCKSELPGYEENQKGVEAFKGMADFLMGKH